MLAQAAEEIPELRELNNELFDELTRIKTRGGIELRLKIYKRDLDDLRNRKIITGQQYEKLSSAIPMRVDYAWAKKTGEVGTPAEVKAGIAEKTPAQWLKEKGYLDRSFMEMLAQDFPLIAAAAYFPGALAEVAKKRAEEIVGLVKPPILFRPKDWPWWTWALVGTAGLAFGVYVLRSVTAAAREARAIVE